MIIQVIALLEYLDIIHAILKRIILRIGEENEGSVIF